MKNINDSDLLFFIFWIVSLIMGLFLGIDTALSFNLESILEWLFLITAFISLSILMTDPSLHSRRTSKKIVIMRLIFNISILYCIIWSGIHLIAYFSNQEIIVTSFMQDYIFTTINFITDKLSHNVP